MFARYFLSGTSCLKGVNVTEPFTPHIDLGGPFKAETHFVYS